GAGAGAGVGRGGDRPPAAARGRALPPLPRPASHQALRTADDGAPLRGGVHSGMKRREDDMALTLVHTADWHLGMRFRQFESEDALKLSRARLEVIDRILGEAQQRRADAVLCAGDLFDQPNPDEKWWEGLLGALTTPRLTPRPIFLLPGNHDPLISGSVWERTHPFRRGLPSHVHVVDRDD